MGRERDWLYPAAAMTLLLAAVATIGDGSPVPLIKVLPLWLLIGFIAFGAVTLGFVLRLMFRGEPSPTRLLLAQLKQAKWPFIGFALAGINLCSFMRVKPLLNHWIPFTADTALARVDRWILFGHDGAQILRPFNSDALAIFYSRAWFAFLIIGLLLTLFRPSSRDRSRLILVYFALWTFAGPLVHAVAPAAGPIFYRGVGLGNHFDFIDLPPKLLGMRDYLWRSYVAGSAGPGAGISAMPSLHIATTAWSAIAIRQIWPGSTGVVAAFTAMIVALSVALGWHYLIDGLVGILCTLVLLKLELFAVAAVQRLMRRGDSHDHSSSGRGQVGPLSG